MADAWENVEGEVEEEGNPKGGAGRDGSLAFLSFQGAISTDSDQEEIRQDPGLEP